MRGRILLPGSEDPAPLFTKKFHLCHIISLSFIWLCSKQKIMRVIIILLLLGTIIIILQNDKKQR